MTAPQREEPGGALPGARQGRPAARPAPPRGGGLGFAAALGEQVSWLMRVRRRGALARGGWLAGCAACGTFFFLIAWASDRALLASLPKTQQRGELVALLRDEVPPALRSELVETLASLPRVSAVNLRGSDEALARLAAELGDRAPLLANVEQGFLPPSLEIEVTGGEGLEAEVSALADRLRASPIVADVDVWRGAPDPRREGWRQTASLLRTSLWILVGALLALVSVVALLRRGARVRAETRVMRLFGLSRLLVASWTALTTFAGSALGIALGGAAWLLVRRGAELSAGGMAARLTGVGLALCWAGAVALGRAMVAVRGTR